MGALAATQRKTRGQKKTPTESGFPYGGLGRNRTGVRGFAIRCITTLLPGRTHPSTHHRRGISSRTGQHLQNGAGNETRTRDLNLGKVALYQLSYSRMRPECYRITRSHTSSFMLETTCFLLHDVVFRTPAPPAAAGEKHGPLRGRDESGAGNETRTRDLNLGKVALYQLSYSRSVTLPWRAEALGLPADRFRALRQRFRSCLRRLPKNRHCGVSPSLRQPFSRLPQCLSAAKKKRPTASAGIFLERETRLELATSTLARLRSTN